MEASFQFKPIKFSWVALHPNPKGVVQFIGGAFFGTFPTLFYRYLLRKLFEEGYTIVAMPFRFSFRHWPIAIQLLKEQEEVREAIAEEARRLGYRSDIYKADLSDVETPYYWVGHSLGCKYIALLEFLSGDRWREIVTECVDAKTVEWIEQLTADIQPQSVSIKGQPSLLLAPDISDTESAIPVPAIAHFLEKIGLGALPTRKQTQCFISQSQLFNLTAMISFNRDTVAGSEQDASKPPKQRDNSDVLWMLEQLKQRKPPLLHKEIPGKHLEPIGVQIGQYIVDLNPLDKFIKPLDQRFLEYFATEFLTELQRKRSS